MNLNTLFKKHIAPVPNLIGMEIGVYKGANIPIFLKTKPACLYLLDCWEKQTGSYEQDILNNEDMVSAYNNVVKTFGDLPNIVIIQQYAHDACSFFKDKYFDWIYFDADHSYNATLRELTDWYPKIKNGGWVCGHDYFQSTDYPWVQCKRAIDEFATEYDGELIVTTTDTYPNWAFKKEISYGE